MNYRQLIVLILVVGSCFLATACSKTNLAVPAMPTAVMVDKQGENTRPLYFINFVEVKDLTKIEPNAIKSISILKPSATNDLVSTYGPKAKNGVVFVTTKNDK